MKRTSGFGGDILSTGALGVLVRAKGIATVPFFVHAMGLGVYGSWVQISALVTLLAPIASLNLSHALVRFTAAEDDGARIRRAYWTACVTSLASSSIAGGLLWWGIDALGSHAGAVGSSELIKALVAVQLPLLAVRRINIGLIRGLGRARVAYAMESALGVLESLAIILVAIWAPGLERVFMSIVVLQAAFAGSSTVVIARRLGWSWVDRNLLVTYLRYSLPILPALFADWVTNLSDRFILGAVWGAEVVGAYAAAYTLANCMLLFASPFEYVLLPRLSALWDRGERRELAHLLTRSLRHYALMAVPAAVILAVGGLGIVQILFTAGAAVRSQVVLPVLVLGMLIWGGTRIFQQSYFAAKQAGKVGGLNAFGAVVNVGVNVVLIPLFGGAGAAVATLVSYAAVAAYSWWRRELRELSVPGLRAVGWLIAASGASTAVILAAAPRTEWELAASFGIAALMFPLVLFVAGELNPEIEYAKAHFSRAEAARH